MWIFLRLTLNWHLIKNCSTSKKKIKNGSALTNINFKSWKKKKTNATLMKGPKCCKHIEKPQFNHMTIIIIIIIRMLWNFGPS
jgi:hypothetical protein